MFVCVWGEGAAPVVACAWERGSAGRDGCCRCCCCRPGAGSHGGACPPASPPTHTRTRARPALPLQVSEWNLEGAIDYFYNSGMSSYAGERCAQCGVCVRVLWGGGGDMERLCGAWPGAGGAPRRWFAFLCEAGRTMCPPRFRRRARPSSSASGPCCHQPPVPALQGRKCRQV